MLKIKQILVLSYFLITCNLPCFSQIAINSGIGMTPQQLVQNFLIGGGVTVSNVMFNNSSATVSVSNQIGSFTTGLPTNLGFNTGLCIATGGVQVATSGTLTVAITGTSYTNDPQLQTLKPGKSLFDIARLEFDFIPSSDTVKFRYVFASNEYLTAVCTNYDDVFGFFITGANPSGGTYNNTNIALVPGTNLPVSINTINGGVSNGNVSPCYLNYTQYFHTPSQNLTYNGATLPLTAWAKVVPCTSYHIKIAICDVSNAIYDSGVFLEANSFSSTLVQISKQFTFPSASDSVMIRGCNNAVIKFKLSNRLNYNYPIVITKQGSAVNGVDYPLIPDTVYIPANTDSLLLTIAPYNNAGFTTPKLLQLIFKTAGCHFDTLNLNILPNLALTVDAKGDTALCNKANIPITVSGNGGVLPYSFVWSDNDTNRNRVVSPAATTLYYVTLKDACLQTARDSVLLTVYPGFSLNVNANPNIICRGTSVLLNVSGAQKYHWSSNITDPTLAIQDTMHNPLVTPPGTILYRVIGTDSHGCRISDSVNVYVHPLLNAAIIANPNPVSIFDPTVHFIDASNASTNWLWNCGDGYTTNVRDFYHTFSSGNPQNYQISLIVSNASGCMDSAKIELIVFPEIKLFIPNAFTPASAINNIFKVYGEGFVGFRMFIYNRWGQLVFFSDNADYGWDGKYLKSDAAAGVYVYLVYYKDLMGIEYRKNGNLTLIR
jgi:gliding motility-associated-like protein